MLLIALAPHMDSPRCPLHRQQKLTLFRIAGKVFDRMSKGVREAPGKALIGELAAASGDRPEGAFGKTILPIGKIFLSPLLLQQHTVAQHNKCRGDAWAQTQ